jgi:hypothetical protein
LDTGKTFDEIGHVDEQATEFLHMVRIGVDDLFNRIDTGLQCTATISTSQGRSLTYPTSSNGRPIHSRNNRLPIRVLQLAVSISSSANDAQTH